MTLLCGQVSDREVRVGKDGVAAKHSPQEADEWQAEVGTLVAEFATKQVHSFPGCRQRRYPWLAAS